MSEGKDRESMAEVAEQLPKMMKALSDSLPEMIAKMMKTLYSEEVGREYGKSVAAFYKTLKDGGIDQDMALHLTMEFMSNHQQFLKSATSKLNGGKAEFTKGSPEDHGPRNR